MFPYFLLLFTSGIIPILIYVPQSVDTIEDEKITQKRNKLTFGIFFFGLFLLLALRDISVGKDLHIYENIFETSSKTPFEKLSKMKWEIGYTAYNKLISMVSTNYRFFLIVTAIVTLLPIYHLYSEEKKYSFLSILLFVNMPCFLMIFSGLRQAIAISIGIWVYLSLEKKKYILSVALMVLAMYFHTSAFILILLYFAFFVKVKTKHLIFIIPAMIAIYMYRIPLLKFVIEVMPEQYEEFYGELKQTGAIGTLLLFLVFSIFSFIVFDEKMMTRKDYCMRNVLLISTVLQFFVPVHALVQRASYYFLVFAPVSLVSVVKAPKKNLKEISDLAILVMCCFFSLYFFYNGLFSTDNLLDVFPYKFYWSTQIW